MEKQPSHSPTGASLAQRNFCHLFLAVCNRLLNLPHIPQCFPTLERYGSLFSGRLAVLVNSLEPGFDLFQGVDVEVQLTAVGAGQGGHVVHLPTHGPCWDVNGDRRNGGMGIIPRVWPDRPLAQRNEHDGTLDKGDVDRHCGKLAGDIDACVGRGFDGYIPVSYTHLTLPTNREV